MINTANSTKLAQSLNLLLFFIFLNFYGGFAFGQNPGATQPDSTQTNSNAPTGENAPSTTATSTPTSETNTEAATQQPSSNQQGNEQAAAAAPTEAPKDESQELPFRYLNQYFAYEVELPQNILLNDRAYNMAEFKTNIEKNRVKVSIGQTLTKNFKTAKLEFLDQQKKRLLERDLQITDSRLAIEAEIPQGLTSMCLVGESKYSVIRICKPVDSKMDDYDSIEDALSKVTADGVELGFSGQVVLQDSNVRSNLSVEFKNGDWFYFETERRKVYPSTINKKADSLQMNIRYVDLDDQTVAYDDVLLVGQRYFEIKLDPLVSLRQDIVFSGEDIRNKAISRTLIDRAKVTIVARNRYILSPLISFHQLVGDNADLSFKLRTTMGYGFMGQYIKNFSPQWDWHAGGSFAMTKIIYDEADKVLSGKDQSLLELYGGVIHHLNRSLDLQGSVGVKNDMFATPINTDEGLEVSVGMNKYLEGVISWNAYENRNLEIVVPFSLRFILGGKAGNVEAKSGTGFDLGAQGLFKMNWGRILIGTKYGSRLQKYDDFNFQEDYYHLMGGVVYLF